MPRTIDEGFRDFLQTLTPSNYETNAAKGHRESIKRCIDLNFSLGRFWRTGSFGNGTSISGYSDVDYMAKISYLPSDSSMFLSKLREVLEERFPRTGVRTNCPAVIVPFGSNANETTEITPADYIQTTNGYHVYDIPDCSGYWMKASPDAHNSYVRQVDTSLSYKLKPLIRFIKAWKYYNDVPISSFYLELRIAKYCSEKPSIVYSTYVKLVLSHLHGTQLARIQDPMRISGYISPCSSPSKLSVAKSKLKTALSRAEKAQDAEANGNIREAFNWWKYLFGNKFPNYYR